MENDGAYGLGVEYVYYRMDIQQLEEILFYWDEINIEKTKKAKGRINSYQRKQYWEKSRLLKNMHKLPWHTYTDRENDNAVVYYKRSYAYNKDTRKKLCRTVRRQINNCINEDYDVCCSKGMSWRKIYDYKYDFW